MKIIINFLMLLFTSITSTAYASTPTCHQHSSGAYCKYSGKVKSIYINASNQILLYFENPINISVPQSYGLNVTHGNATMFDLDDNPEFAKLFYSTSLAAQASGRNISIQMRGTLNGYLKFDRIWLSD